MAGLERGQPKSSRRPANKATRNSPSQRSEEQLQGLGKKLRIKPASRPWQNHNTPELQAANEHVGVTRDAWTELSTVVKDTCSRYMTSQILLPCTCMQNILGDLLNELNECISDDPHADISCKRLDRFTLNLQAEQKLFRVVSNIQVR